MLDEAGPPIVGIGASAGGVKALQAFFDALPSTTGAAYAVVVHLVPDSRSELANILASRTAMKVQQVEGEVRLEADHVYIIPPSRRLRIADHMIAALPFDQPQTQRAAIDLFFRSLADQHNDGFAIILTGAGSDGAIGVRAIKEAGGIVLVQDPAEAEYASMPRSAIATAAADFILPLRELVARLVELLAARQDHITPTEEQNAEGTLRRVLAHLRARTGHDFSMYKKATVLRRIARRAHVARRESISDYYEYLKENAEEAQSLFNDLLISVTTFFRDPKSFASLAQHVIPQLLEGRDSSDAIRIWVPGCATGEEAYSIGMLLLEEAGRREVRPEIQIFGTDLDAGALATAREGRFPAAIEADVSEDRLQRFFQREGDHYRVRRELRDVVMFAGHSLLRDPPFSRLDLVSCRNLLIYLDRELQKQVCSTFHYALVPGGYLFLGASESADQPSGLFRPVDRDARIYRAVAVGADRRPTLPVMLGPRLAPTFGPGIPRATTPVGSASDAALHRQMLEKIAPPSMLVDEMHRAVHLSENAGRYLQPSGGPVTTDAIDLLREEFRFDARAALHKAFERGESSLSMPLLVRINGTRHRVLLQVKPVVQSNDPTRHALILFIEDEASQQPYAEVGEDGEVRESPNNTIRQLQEELQLVQGRLRSTREESEAANEELRAANEELQSINEEYRSTSEELETSKEELQSINEELQTVNAELKMKLESVSRAHSDLQNLMAAPDFGILFLDPSLRIKRFTPALTRLFNVTVSDEGRPITDFTHQLEYDGLAEHVRAVLKDLAPQEHAVKGRDGEWFLVRIRPYRTIDDKIDGVVATFIDITERRRAEDALKASEERLRQEARLVDLSRSPIFVWDFDDGITRWNRGSEELYGYSPEEALGRLKHILLRTVIPGSSFEALRQELLRDGRWKGELLHHTKDGRTLTVESQLELFPYGGRRLVLESTRDITEQKKWERRRRLLLEELSHRVKNTIAVVQSMARQTLRDSKSIDIFVEEFDGRLSALAAAHHLLIKAEWEGADLQALAQSQLSAHVGGEHLVIQGEPVRLPAHLATPFGLILHELATNAAKYGSLSTEAGRVRLSWRTEIRDAKTWLVVIWQEEGGPPVTKPETQGLGGALIESGLPDARVRRDFAPGGLTCTIEVELAEADPDG